MFNFLKKERFEVVRFCDVVPAERPLSQRWARAKSNIPNVESIIESLTRYPKHLVVFDMGGLLTMEDGTHHFARIADLTSLDVEVELLIRKPDKNSHGLWTTYLAANRRDGIETYEIFLNMCRQGNFKGRD